MPQGSHVCSDLVTMCNGGSPPKVADEPYSSRRATSVSLNKDHVACPDITSQASLIPPEVEGNSNKDVAPTKGKKDKDPKGKKGHDSGGKGGKGGGKGDSLAESTFAPPGGPTALPPCPVLASLVDVVGSRSSPQVRPSVDSAFLTRKDAPVVLGFLHLLCDVHENSLVAENTPLEFFSAATFVFYHVDCV